MDLKLCAIGNLGGPEGSASAPPEQGLRGMYRQGPTLRALADRIADAITKGMGPLRPRSRHTPASESCVSENDMHSLMRGDWGGPPGCKTWEQSEPVFYSTPFQCFCQAAASRYPSFNRCSRASCLASGPAYLFVCPASLSVILIARI